MAGQMDEKTRAELQHMLELEQQKAQFQSMIHQFSNRCFDLCVGTPGGSLSRSEQACLGNCVERFLDTTYFIVNRLETLRGPQ